MRLQGLWRGLIAAVATFIFLATVQASHAEAGVPVRFATLTDSNRSIAATTAIYRPAENQASVELARYGRRWYGGYRGVYRPYRAYYRPFYRPYRAYYPGPYYYPGYTRTPGFSYYYYGW